MRKLVAMAALAAGLMIGSGANAAAIDIFLTQNSPSDWALSASTDGSTSLGALNLLLTGLTVMQTNATSIGGTNAGISDADSSLTVDGIEPGVHFMIVQNTATGVAIAGPSSVQVLLATLSGPTGPVTLMDTSAFGGLDNGVFLASGDASFDYSITVVPTPVPEPVSMVLLGLGLAALGVVRRSA